MKIRWCHLVHQVFDVGLPRISEYVSMRRIQILEVMARTFSGLLLVALTLSLSASHQCAQAAAPAKVDFNRHVKPLLSDRCFACHGPDEKGRKGKLRLDTQDGAFKALADGMFVIKSG